MAAGTWFLIDRAPRRILLAEACVACVLNSVLVSQSATPGGAIADAFAYVWLTVYVAAFFPRAWWPFGLLVAAAFGGGLIGAGLDANLFSAWMVLSVSVLMAGFVVAMISRAMLGRMSTDALTGTLNRSGLHDAARRLRLRRRRDTPIVTVAALDLDGFKAVNDTSGHATGDRLLAEATAAWRSALRADDVLARTGGDEFIVLMPNTAALRGLGRPRPPPLRPPRRLVGRHRALGSRRAARRLHRTRRRARCTKTSTPPARRRRDLKPRPPSGR